MTIIQSLIASLEKNNNNKLIEKLEILERFVSSEESNKLSTAALNKLISDRVNSNNKQDGIKDVEEDTTKSDVSKSDEKEEVIESDNIMSKFKWVLIGIGIFVLLIFISSIIYWYMNMSSTPSEVPVLQPVVAPTDTISQSSHIQTNLVSEPQEYSYIPEIFQSNSKKSEELRFMEEERPQNELRSSRKEEQKAEDLRGEEIVKEVRGEGTQDLRGEEIVKEVRVEKTEDLRGEEIIKEVRVEKTEDLRGEEIIKEVRVEKTEDLRGEEIERKEEEKVEEKNIEEVQQERRSQKEKIFQQEKISLGEEKEDILKNKGYKLSSKSNFPL